VVHEVGLSRLIFDESLGASGDPLASGAGRSRNSSSIVIAAHGPWADPAML